MISIYIYISYILRKFWISPWQLAMKIRYVSIMFLLKIFFNGSTIYCIDRSEGNCRLSEKITKI